jgi:hypothetical protein
VAGAVLLLAYLQAAFGIIPLKHDPLARLLGVDMGDVAGQVATLARNAGAQEILTSDYETTAWLRFYAPGLPLVAVDQPNRYLDAADAVVGPGPVLYFADRPDGAVTGSFTTVTPLADIPRQRNGEVIALYRVWRLDARKTPMHGKTP